MQFCKLCWRIMCVSLTHAQTPRPRNTHTHRSIRSTSSDHFIRSIRVETKHETPAMAGEFGRHCMMEWRVRGRGSKCRSGCDAEVFICTNTQTHTPIAMLLVCVLWVHFIAATRPASHSFAVAPSNAVFIVWTYAYITRYAQIW